MLYYSQKAEGEYLSEIAELKAALSAAKADRGKCRAILDGVVNVLVENGEVYCGVSAQIADLKTERDQLRAEVKRLTLEVNMDLDRLRAALSVAEADRGKWRGILDEIADVLVGKGVAYSSADFSAQIADLKAERDQLRAEVERLEEVCGLTLGGTYETGNYQRLHETAVAAHKRHTLRMQRKNAVAMGLPDDHPIFQDPYPGPEAPSQEPEAGSAGADNAPAASVPACSCNRAPQSWTSPTIAWQNALQGIRWALADLGLRVHEMRSVEATAEATMSAVEVLCVHLRKEGRVWTGEMLGGLTCPSQMQKEDNAALKQRVFTALGTELLYRLVRHAEVDPDLVAQFDLLGRDL